MSFAIITASTSDISPSRAQELGIYVIPLHVNIEGEGLLDQVQITAEEYVARMAGSEQLPHTSQPSAGEFKALFDRVRADGHDSAIFISLCSEWSACYANASLTAEPHELDVRCIDSRTGAGAAQTYLVGESQLLHQPEFRDPDKAHRLMSYLSDGSNLLEIPMEQLGGENEVRVLIGPENVAEELRDSSVVLATYDAGENMRGLIGVVGPTRMDYSKVAAKLSFIAAGLSKLLGGGPLPPPGLDNMRVIK